MKEYKFIKQFDNKWYIDLLEWEGPQSALEIVAGADIMLDIIAQEENNVVLSIALEPLEGFDELVKLRDNAGGGDYLLKTYKGQEYNLEMWLCEVTAYVFGYLPDIIYIK